MPMIKIESSAIGQLMIIDTDKITLFVVERTESHTSEEANCRFIIDGMQLNINYMKILNINAEPSHEEKCVKAIEKAMRERV